MYYVYVLKSSENKHYIGYSADLETRITAHNNGKARTTKGQTWELIYYEAYKDEHDARARERSIKKSGKGRKLLYARLENSLR